MGYFGGRGGDEGIRSRRDLVGRRVVEVVVRVWRKVVEVVVIVRVPEAWGAMVLGIWGGKLCKRGRAGDIEQ